MDILGYLLVIVVVQFGVSAAFSSQCLRGCSCVEDRHGRSLTCMEDSLFRSIPDELPEGLTKVRIEKSHFAEIPQGVFSRSTALENLWLNFNEIALINSKGLEGLSNLTELRLQGNKLRSLPWTAFEDTPSLKILDLKHNQLDVLPEHALKYLPGLTYLDLSFNQLTVISKEVFLNWPLYQKLQSQEGPEGGAVGPNVVLALHDNPWLCDCRLKGFVEFTRSLSPPILLMNSYLSCSGPDFKAGQFFHEVDVRSCIKPVVSTATANMSLPQGANATMRCLAKARPQASLWWTYGLKIIRGFHEFQERVDEDTVRSFLVIPSLHVSDRGLYTCTAVNYMGNSSATIQLDVQTTQGSTAQSPRGDEAPPPSAEENIYIDIRIAKQTVRGISIEWHAALEHPDQTWFTIHFGRINEKKEAIFIGPGINSYTVNDLLPATKYEICVTLKNQNPRPGQCIVFVTGSDITEMEQREKLIYIVVIVLAMVLAVPIGMYACTTDTKLVCVERILSSWKNRRASRTPGMERQRQGTFDSLQAASDEGLVNKDSSDDRKVRRRSEDRSQKGRLSAQLY